jgi:hypothetical protein
LRSKILALTEHATLITIWNMTTHGTYYREPGADFHTQLNPDKAKNRALDQSPATSASLLTESRPGSMASRSIDPVPPEGLVGLSP